jgi:hypothetical protein
MFTKTKLALVGALLLGVGTMAQAGSRDDADHTVVSKHRVHAYAYARTPTRPTGDETYIGVQSKMYRRSEGIRHSHE